MTTNALHAFITIALLIDSIADFLEIRALKSRIEALENLEMIHEA